MTAKEPQGADWHRRTATEIAAAVRSGHGRAADIIASHLAQIDRIDPELNAFVEVWGDEARRAAEAIDGARAAGRPLGALAGVPIAIKDNFALSGHVSSCGSRMLEHWRSPYTACAVERLLAADAVLIGRTNMDEFGMGSSTERSIHGATRNPVDPTRTAGGSSGGSAAAVAAHCAALALGSDTGGSVRQPAAMCGIAGLKPTYGRVPRHGLVAFASSLDTVAPLARSVHDLALVQDVIAGDDPRDSTAIAKPAASCVAALGTAAARGGRLDGLAIGIPEAAFGAGLEPEVEATVRTAIESLCALGARPVPVDLPYLEHAVAVYYLTCTAEASSNLARYDGVRYGFRTANAETLDGMIAASRSEAFGDEVKLRILLGTFGLSSGYVDAYYDKASRVRTLIREGFEQALGRCDLLAMPTSPFVAWPLGSMLDDPMAMYLADVLTVAPSLAGVPALSVPCGVGSEGLPIGLQLVGPDSGEAALLRCGAAFERAREDRS